MSDEIVNSEEVVDEEQNTEDISKEIPNPEEEQILDDTIIQDQGHLSNANEIDIAETTETLSKTDANTIINAIIISLLVLFLFAIIFYIKKKTNLLKNSKNK